ncbi:hypothetical protein SAMN05216582_10969 [Selenomonas ruminantium]|uniref:Uncharacterized protein n=1 Tax=Selenomonas ruminantium TaxID=971 RepID=A0A1M6TVT2_SELRU|nr:hypothetical protein [Selenomonas ruminantium]SHK61046.1 hypothetical protein SAMN05216582_10969 [Selenomonas ruminantium]
MRKYFSLCVAFLLLMMSSVCFASTSSSGNTNGSNAVHLHVQGPNNSKLIYAKMPAFILTFKDSHGKAAKGHMIFVNKANGHVISARSVHGKTNFVPPNELRDYIIVFKPDAKNQVVYWSVKKNTSAVGNRYFYELHPMRYQIKSVG